MTNHPNRSKPNLMFIENGYAHIAIVDVECGDVQEIVTSRLHPDRYVKIDDGRNYPQLCKGAARMGVTLSYHSDAQLASECKAKLYKTRERYEAAVAAAREAISIY
jgi:hypothetical protein